MIKIMLILSMLFTGYAKAEELGGMRLGTRTVSGILPIPGLQLHLNLSSNFQFDVSLYYLLVFVSGELGGKYIFESSQFLKPTIAYRRGIEAGMYHFDEYHAIYFGLTNKEVSMEVGVNYIFHASL